jgi:hypothetical protein
VFYSPPSIEIICLHLSLSLICNLYLLVVQVFKSCVAFSAFGFIFSLNNVKPIVLVFYSPPSIEIICLHLSLSLICNLYLLVVQVFRSCVAFSAFGFIFSLNNVKPIVLVFYSPPSIEIICLHLSLSLICNLYLLVVQVFRSCVAFSAFGYGFLP